MKYCVCVGYFFESIGAQEFDLFGPFESIEQAKTFAATLALAPDQIAFPCLIKPPE